MFDSSSSHTAEPRAHHPTLSPHPSSGQTHPLVARLSSSAPPPPPPVRPALLAPSPQRLRLPDHLGFPRPRDTVVVLALALAATCMATCTPVREALLAPHHAGECDPGPADATLPTLCRDAVPYVCSRQGHLWPATPSGAPCPGGCVADDGGARCAPLDASTTPTSGDLGGAP